MQNVKTIVTGLVFLLFFTQCTYDHCDTIPQANYPNYGCGYGFIYDQLSTDTSSYITIDIDHENLLMDDIERTYDIVGNSNIIVKIEKLNMATSYPNYCTDVLNPNLQIIDTWNATAGQIKLKVMFQNACPTREEYVLTIDLINASFTDSASNVINIPSLKIDSVYVMGLIP